MHVGFHQIIQKIFSKTHDDLGLINASFLHLPDLQELYLSHEPEKRNPRDAFEKSVMKLVNGQQNARLASIELMNIANQAYHYNFAMCLSDEMKNPIVADTSVGLAFEDMLDLDDSVEAEILDVPLIDIPRNIASTRGADFTGLLDPSSKIGESKNNFLLMLDAAFRQNSGTLSNRKLALQEAAAEYRAKLAEYFASRGFSVRTDSFISNGVGSAISLGIDTLGGAVGVADWAGLAIGVLTDPLRRQFHQFLLRPLRRRMTEVSLAPIGEAPDNYIRFRLRDIRPRFASLAFNPEKVKQHVASIPRMLP